ncbi:ABC transporter permease [Bacillus haynesii]|uniref:ABC transporter permease n=1 Tax=Bacillus haynesii TaxID=1925021 RepID=UPI0022824304|nr:ABC transporter permease [Bacillus haynesii]MCY7817544.1 ABC transporter permease [Bacillus haynesii]MCY8224209.1 ABC transporter permease [Bacillus haynesii]MCY8241842.1 ABC transporter permease [Bacillus haynesii]MCY8567611.1 ABC transporter permease [Bacillus haynesii]MCY8663490.1 ABC transporter permease [Bacillus haynesii]
MSGRSLFFSRLKADCLYQLRIIKLVIDWTVALYIVLPAAGIGVYQYIKWLNGGSFHNGWQAGLIVLAPAVFTLFGSVRTFLMEADQLYLLQKKTLVVNMKRCGYLYCLFVQFCKWLFAAAVFIPLFVRQFGVELNACLAVFFFYFCLNSLITVLKQRKFGRQYKLKHRVLDAGLIFFVWLSACAVVLFFVWPIVLLSGLVLLTAAVKTAGGTLGNMFLFYEEVEFDNRRKLRLAKFFLAMNLDGSVPKPGKREAKRPRLFFKKSQKIFKARTVQNGLKEIFFKVMLRHPDYKRQLMQMIGIFTALMMVGPLWMKTGALLVFAFAYRSLLSVHFDKVMERVFLLGADKESDAFYEARRSSIDWLFYPGLIWCSLVIALSLMLKIPSF